MNMELSSRQQALIKRISSKLRSRSQLGDYLRIARNEWLVDLPPEWEKMDEHGMRVLVVYALAERMRKLERLTGRKG